MLPGIKKPVFGLFKGLKHDPNTKSASCRRRFFAYRGDGVCVVFGRGRCGRRAAAPAGRAGAARCLWLRQRAAPPAPGRSSFGQTGGYASASGVKPTETGISCQLVPSVR